MQEGEQFDSMVQASLSTALFQAKLLSQKERETCISGHPTSRYNWQSYLQGQPPVAKETPPVKLPAWQGVRWPVQGMRPSKQLPPPKQELAIEV